MMRFQGDAAWAVPFGVPIPTQPLTSKPGTKSLTAGEIRQRRRARRTGDRQRAQLVAADRRGDRGGACGMILRSIRPISTTMARGA
jgi:hypothetical protein